MKQEQIKALIELSNSYNEANEIIEKYTNFKTYSEKIDYITKMFDCEIFSKNTNDDEADYVALLTSVVDKKWR